MRAYPESPEFVDATDCVQTRRSLNAVWHVRDARLDDIISLQGHTFWPDGACSCLLPEDE